MFKVMMLSIFKNKIFFSEGLLKRLIALVTNPFLFSKVRLFWPRKLSDKAFYFIINDLCKCFCLKAFRTILIFYIPSSGHLEYYLDQERIQCKDYASTINFEAENRLFHWYLPLLSFSPKDAK